MNKNPSDLSDDASHAVSHCSVANHPRIPWSLSDCTAYVS